MAPIPGSSSWAKPSARTVYLGVASFHGCHLNSSNETIKNGYILPRIEFAGIRMFDFRMITTLSGHGIDRKTMPGSIEHKG